MVSHIPDDRPAGDRIDPDTGRPWRYTPGPSTVEFGAGTLGDVAPPAGTDRLLTRRRVFLEAVRAELRAHDIGPDNILIAEGAWGRFEDHPEYAAAMSPPVAPTAPPLAEAIAFIHALTRPRDEVLGAPPTRDVFFGTGPDGAG
jgi:hypothetical protein|tara:strand:+ start:400 stop:831 length:432 start_codon:yes stop_codon:yes gene_type:complete